MTNAKCFRPVTPCLSVHARRWQTQPAHWLHACTTSVSCRRRALQTGCRLRALFISIRRSLCTAAPSCVESSLQNGVLSVLACLLLLWCRAVVGDRAMPELSVSRSHDEMCWTHFILPWFVIRTNYRDTSVSDAPLLSSHAPILPVTTEFRRPWLLETCPRKASCRDGFFSLVYAVCRCLFNNSSFIMKSTAGGLSGSTKIDDLERPWTREIGVFSGFFSILGCDTHLKSELRWNYWR